MENQISITTWVGKFLKGEFDAKDRDTQCDAGWYDWFCKDTALAGKTDVLGRKLLQILKSKKFDSDKTYVFFKNNCPMNGKLYDDFRICDLETGKVIYTVIPKNGHRVHNGQADVWGRENDFEGPLVQGTWKDVLRFFLAEK